jgi:hypothetical protein
MRTLKSFLIRSVTLIPGNRLYARSCSHSEAISTAFQNDVWGDRFETIVEGKRRWLMITAI